jgi:hypothetical protein
VFAKKPGLTRKAGPSPPQPNLSAGPRTHLPIEVLRRPVESAMEPGLRQGVSFFQAPSTRACSDDAEESGMDSAVVSTFTSG